MNPTSIRAIVATTLSAGLIGWVGCDSASPDPAAGGPGGPPPPAGPGRGPDSPIRSIMRKLDDRRPGGLTKAVVDGMKAEQPDWATLETQSAEYARLTSELAKLDPPRGNKESWTRLTSGFRDSAVELEKAARANKKDDALAAIGEITKSCMGCHREHRMMPGGPRGGFGPPPSGPPPG